MLEFALGFLNVQDTFVVYNKTLTPGGEDGIVQQNILFSIFSYRYSALIPYNGLQWHPMVMTCSNLSL